jgi:cytochrome c oxidase subunit IV
MERMKGKNKKVASGVAVFLLIQWEQLPCGAKMQQALIFWPLCLLVLRAVATLCPVHFCAVEDE